MDESLNKLDLLDDMWVRNSDMEKQFKKLDSNISDIKNDLNQQAQVINNDEFHYDIVEERVSTTECENDRLKLGNHQIKDSFHEVQPHFKINGGVFI